MSYGLFGGMGGGEGEDTRKKIKKNMLLLNFSPPLHRFLLPFVTRNRCPFKCACEGLGEWRVEGEVNGYNCRTRPRVEEDVGGKVE